MKSCSWDIFLAALLLVCGCHHGIVEAFRPATTVVQYKVGRGQKLEFARRHSDNHNDYSKRILPILKAKKVDNQQDKEEKKSYWEVIQEKPATLVALPFVVVIGLDLLANIFFLSKRTIEYFAFGKVPSTEVWFSDNLFVPDHVFFFF